MSSWCPRPTSLDVSALVNRLDVSLNVVSPLSSTPYSSVSTRDGHWTVPKYSRDQSRVLSCSNFLSDVRFDFTRLPLDHLIQIKNNKFNRVYNIQMYSSMSLSLQCPNSLTILHSRNPTGLQQPHPSDCSFLWCPKHEDFCSCSLLLSRLLSRDVLLHI